jgi:hypothetical protein
VMVVAVTKVLMFRDESDEFLAPPATQ